jgi:hypothetical protein
LSYQSIALQRETRSFIGIRNVTHRVFQGCGTMQNCSSRRMRVETLVAPRAEVVEAEEIIGISRIINDLQGSGSLAYSLISGSLQGCMSRRPQLAIHVG